MDIRKIFLLISVIFTVMTDIQAQGTGSCASDAINDTLLNHDPVFSRSFHYMEQMLMIQHGLEPNQRTNDVYTLPVVVHVIHNGEPYGTGTNITDEQIFSAIAAMNNDYRHIAGTNGDGAGPDIGIEFCMAVRNPSGQPTNGIVRVNGSSVPLYSTQGIETSGGNGAVEESVKALSTWPRESYVNIWVVNEIDNNDGGAGVQGYAYFPFNNPVDGIVVLYNAFGTVGTLKTYTNMNRTITHEMGHYLGLYHTFNGTTTCAAEANCATAGDRVCDTPVTIQSSSCSTPACGGTQQVENYMDYTSQTCQDMFTEGQKLRMRTTLETQRPTMITSLGCMPVYTVDVGVHAIINPTGTNCAGGLQPQITLTNFGSNTLTTCAIMYNVDGIGSNTYNWTGSLAAGNSITVTLGSINPNPGAHTLYAWTSSPNGTSDQNTSNDQATGEFAISTGAPAILDVVLDYFGSETTWQITDASGNLMMNGGPYANSAQGLHNPESICLAPGCYTLTMIDAYGDGQGFTSGNFSLTSGAGVLLASGSGNWGATSAHEFCIIDDTPAGDPPVASFTIQDNSICKNVQNDFTNTSTNAPTSYSWTFEGGTPATSTQASPQNVTWASAGTYDVTLTATNTYGSNTYTCANCITIYADPTVTATGVNPTCNTTSNGSITTVVTGSSPYTYSWSSGQTSANISNVAAGSYTVTVTDSHACSKQASATLTAPTAITITGTPANITCDGANNGSITVSATGGTGTKTFSWSNGASGATVSNLIAGSYTVTATDANSCTKTQSFTITAPSAIAITGTTTNITCSGSNNGNITVSATGGTGNKTFSWSNGATGATISNLTAGSYTVTATDASGCTKTQSFAITSPTAIVLSGTPTNITCAGVNNGSITVSASGGTGTKTYSWSNGGSGSSIGNLSAGTYTVTVTDANGCSISQTYTISAPTAITITGTVTNATCSGQNNGSITVSATGGTGTKTFSWSNGAVGATASNLAPGSYVVTATDASGCTKTQTFTVNGASAITVTGTVTQVGCSGGNNGAIIASASGGSGTMTYSWSNGTIGNTAMNLIAGTYGVTATDVNGCSGTQSFTITAPSALVMNLQDFDIACDDLFGSALVNPTGGTAPYTTTWSNGNSGNNSGNLSAGTYSVITTDAHGCSANGTFEITQNASLNVSITSSNITCNGSGNGTANVAVNGGSNSYTYLWSNGSTAALLNGLSQGTYGVIVTDSNGCQGSAEVQITEPAILNVLTDFDHISCFGLNDGLATTTVFGGTSPYSYEWNNGSTDITLSNLAPGTYTVLVTDANGCTESQSIQIAEPDMLTANVIILSSETCAGNDGSAEVSVEGGSPGYFISWSTGSNATVLESAASGTYQLAVTDVNGCLLNLDVTIPYECVTNVPSTQLIGSDCNAVDMALNAIITCNEVTGASMYQWRFSTPTGTIISDEYSLGNMFYVSQIPNISEGSIYMIGIKALVDGNWGPFGEICSIATVLPDNVIPGLTAADCGSTITAWGTQLNAIVVPDVVNYQWHITGPNYDWTTYTIDNILVLESNMQLMPGQTYSVQMRCSLGADTYTDWGPPCDFSIDATIQVDEITTSNGFILIYPNPGDGEKIFFDLSNLGEGVTVENLELFGPTGSLIEKFMINLSPGSSKTYQHNFTNKLASGVYVLRYKLNAHDREEKLVVR